MVARRPRDSGLRGPLGGPARPGPARPRAASRSEPAEPDGPKTPRQPEGTRAARGRSPAAPRSAAQRPATRSGSIRPTVAQGPASSRPANPGRTTPGGVSGSDPARVRRPPVIRPVTVLAGTLVVLSLLLAPYVKQWLAQRSQIEEKEAEVTALQEEVNELAQRRDRWKDNRFVETQARERLHFVRPGETGYVALDAAGAGRDAVDPRHQAALTAGAGRDAGEPWYGSVWQSLRIAGDDRR
jgi:cell division protein FtsB